MYERFDFVSILNYTIHGIRNYVCTLMFSQALTQGVKRFITSKLKHKNF